MERRGEEGREGGREGEGEGMQNSNVTIIVVAVYSAVGGLVKVSCPNFSYLNKLVS